MSMLLWGFSLLLLAGPARAHGPNPAGIEVVSATATNATLIKLNRGAALNQDNEWRFVCQLRWGGPETPLMASDSEHTWIAATEGLQLLLPTGQTQPAGSPELNATTVRMLVTVGSVTVALTGFGEQSTLWRLELNNSTAIVETSFIGTVTAHNGLLLTGSIQSGQLHVQSYDSSGNAIGDSAVYGQQLSGSPSLRPLGNELYLLLRAGEDYTFHRVSSENTELLLSSKNPIHGPVQYVGDTLIVADHVLSRLDGNEIFPLEPNDWATCLKAHPALGPYVCVEPNIRALAPGGVLGEPIFELKDLRTPDLSGLGEEGTQNCQLDWLDFATDAALPLGLDDDPEPEDPPVADSGGSCTIVQDPPSQGHAPVFVLVLLMIALWTKRICIRPC